MVAMGPRLRGDDSNRVRAVARMERSAKACRDLQGPPKPKGKDAPLSRGRMENALQHYKVVTLRELQSSNVVDPGVARHTRDTNPTTLSRHCTRRLSSEGHRTEAHMRSLTVVSLLLASTAGAMSAEIKAT